VVVVSCRDDRTWGAEVVEKELGIGADIERKNDTEYDCRGLRERRVFLATTRQTPDTSTFFRHDSYLPATGSPQTILMIPNTG
jgi:hypothetical protein